MTRARKWTLGGLVTVMAIVGAVFTSGSATGINVWRIGNHDTKFVEIQATIEANKIECDRKIEEIQKRFFEHMKIMIEVKNDVKWIKHHKQEGGDNPN